MIRVVIKKFSPVALVVAILFSNVPVAHAADPLSATRSPSAAANFGLAIAAQNTDPDAAHNAHVDGATVTVYYYEADTTPPIDTPPDSSGNIGTSTLVWGNADGTNPQQITLEDGGTYAVPLNTEAPAYIVSATAPVIGR